MSQATESLFAENHEHFFNSIDPQRKSCPIVFGVPNIAGRAREVCEPVANSVEFLSETLLARRNLAEVAYAVLNSRTNACSSPMARSDIAQ